MKTDRGRDFRIGEVLREKLMAALDREVPYGLAVEIGAVEETESLAKIDALIWVAKDSQRPIVVGRGGETLKTIGRAARLDLEQLLGKKVFLQTHVKVRRNWADDARALRQFGYEAESVTAIERVELEPAFVLHGRAYRETSELLEVVTRDHGRVSLVAQRHAPAEVRPARRSCSRSSRWRCPGPAAEAAS